MKLLVTGGAGFIGSAVIRHLVNDLGCEVINLDSLTYAGNLESLRGVESNPHYEFRKIDICDYDTVERAFNETQPDKVMHLAAESHVDRSIDSPGEFIQSNVVGTYVMIEVARRYWGKLCTKKKKLFRFHHISTDEVYGDLKNNKPPFTEDSLYAPSSPYSASKAGSDHLVRAWNRTYGFPIVVTNCSNNYGPYQFPEKLIPLIILNALAGKPLPLYGDGQQVRDWLYVEDHARALVKVIMEGSDGQTYNIGGHNQKTNLEVVKLICRVLDEVVLETPAGIKTYAELITFVTNRPGHDQRYAINAGKIEEEIGWVPDETFETGIRKTVEWYLTHRDWCKNVMDGSYKGERLGVCG